MYGKLFEQMYDGTLSESWQALITFQQMIILCDDSGVVDLTPGAISRRTGIPIEHIESGIKVLESDDPYSRTPDENGRRIVRLDSHRPWGWRIVNHHKYRQMASYEDKKRADRERMAAKRESEKSQDVASCSDLSQEVADVAHTYTYTNTYIFRFQRKTDLPKDIHLTDDMKAYFIHQCAKGDVDEVFEDFTNHHGAAGSKFKDWHRAWQKWVRNHVKWNGQREISEFCG